MSFLFDKLFQKQNPALASQMAQRGLIFDRISHRWIKKPENRAQPVSAPKSRTQPADEHAATELEMFISNDEPLYRQQWTPIIRNLVRRKKKGTYDSEKAIKLFEYLTQAGARKYRKEYGGGTDLFTPATRRLAAIALRDEFEGEYDYGNYENDTFQ